MKISIDIKKLFEKLNITNCRFLYKYRESKEHIKDLNIPNNDFIQNIKSQVKQKLANFIIEEKGDIIEEKEIIDYTGRVIEFNTELYVLTKEELENIVKEIEHIINNK